MAIVGFSPSIMRAGLVSAMSFIAWYTGRKFAPWRIILIVATITLLIEPAFLNNLGWQLSFASFGGIMIIAPLLTKYLYGRKKPIFFAQTIIATAAATLMTAPISLYHFGALSIVAFVANLIILPTLPYVMGLTFATGIIGGLPVVGSLISLATEFALKIHIAVINFFGSQEIFLIEMPKNQPQVFLLYIPMLAGLLWIRQKQQKMIKLEKLTGENNVRTQQVGHHQTSESRRRRKARRVVYKNWQSNCHRSAWRYRSKHEPFPCHGA
jgi:competence protein ComEC